MHHFTTRSLCDVAPHHLEEHAIRLTEALPSQQVDMTRRKLNAMLIMAPFAAWSATSKAQSSEPPYVVTDFNWVDQVRSRPVPVRLYWPRDAVAEASTPLVVFSHGIGGSRQGYSYLGKHLSARGIACLHVQHVGSDAELWRGNPFSLIGRLQAAAQEREAIARATDVRFALDRMLADEMGSLGAAVDRQRLVAAGHSYGANTTLLTVGAQVVREGRAIDCLDSRFSAAVVISAPPFYGEHDLAGILSRIAVPTMHVTATDDVIEIPGYHSGAGDRLDIFNAIPHPDKMLAVFRGGSHSMFTDRALTGGPWLNGQVKQATAELAVAFLEQVFNGRSAELAQWQAMWQPILARVAGSAFVADRGLPAAGAPQGLLPRARRLPGAAHA